MRALALLCILAIAAGACAIETVEPRCDFLDAQQCEDAWRLARPHLHPGDGAASDIWIGPAGGAAECHPLPCPEHIGVVVYYRSGVEHTVSLQVTGGLRVTGSQRVVREPPPDGGGKDLPPGDASAR
jgi:hypothetical protein